MRRFPILQRRKFYGNGGAEIAWFGRDLDAPAWDDPELRTLSYMLGGRDGPRLFIILNADHRSQGVALPPSADRAPWRRVIDTSLPSGQDFVEEGREAASITRSDILHRPGAWSSSPARESPLAARRRNPSPLRLGSSGLAEMKAAGKVE